MNAEPIVNKVFDECECLLYRVRLANGRDKFVARTAFKNGEIVMLDHWNLAILQKQILELLPVMQMARKLI